jgi:hypothetical protein
MVPFRFYQQQIARGDKLITTEPKHDSTWNWTVQLMNVQDTLMTRGSYAVMPFLSSFYR